MTEYQKYQTVDCRRTSARLPTVGSSCSWSTISGQKPYCSVATSIAFSLETGDVYKRQEQYFGEVENVFHELVSPDIHVDICIVPPSEKRDYYTLVTMGMGAHRMKEMCIRDRT